MNQFVLTVKIGSKYVALNIQDTQETLRPLPVEPFSNLPSFILGLSMIRGVQTPVFSLKKFLEGSSSSDTSSENKTLLSHIWVTIKVTQKPIAIEVDSIAGIYEIPTDLLQNVPTIIAHAHPDCISACGILDHNLLLMLQSSYLIPKEVWQKLDPLMGSSVQKRV